MFFSTVVTPSIGFSAPLAISSSGSGRLAQALFILLLLAIALFLRQASIQRTQAFHRKYYARLRKYRDSFADKDSRVEMADTFRHLYAEIEKREDLEEPWKTLHCAITTDRKTLQFNDRVFADAVAYLGMGLQHEDLAWRIDPPRVLLDLSVSRQGTAGTPMDVDLALVLGEAIERGELDSDIRMHELIASEAEPQG